jgi:hypothetical protein
MLYMGGTILLAQVVQGRQVGLVLRVVHLAQKALLLVQDLLVALVQEALLLAQGLLVALVQEVARVVVLNLVARLVLNQALVLALGVLVLVLGALALAL